MRLPIIALATLLPITVMQVNILANAAESPNSAELPKPAEPSKAAEPPKAAELVEPVKIVFLNEEPLDISQIPVPNTDMKLDTSDVPSTILYRNSIIAVFAPKGTPILTSNWKEIRIYQSCTLEENQADVGKISGPKCVKDSNVSFKLIDTDNLGTVQATDVTRAYYLKTKEQDWNLKNDDIIKIQFQSSDKHPVQATRYFQFREYFSPYPASAAHPNLTQRLFDFLPASFWYPINLYGLRPAAGKLPPTIAALPINVAFGTKLNLGTSYIGISAMLGYAVAPSTSSSSGSGSSNLNISSFSYGGILDLNGILTLGYAVLQSFSTQPNPGYVYVLGFKYQI